MSKYSWVAVLSIAIVFLSEAYSSARQPQPATTQSSKHHLQRELIVEGPPTTEASTQIAVREPDPPHEGPVRIARWKDDKTAAVTFTFDDGIEDQATIAAPMLESFGFRGTFFICPGRTPDKASEVTTLPSGHVPYASWEQWKLLSDKGHEIGSHTWDHIPLDKPMSPNRLNEEIVHSRKAIEQSIGLPVFSFAYPFNIETAEARKLVDATYAVAASGKRRWFGGHHFKTGTANHEIDIALANQGWQVAMIHAIETGYGAFTSREVLRAHLEYVKERNNQLWVDTFGTIGRYHREVHWSRLRLKGSSSNEATFIVHCGSLDPVVFNLPITVVISAPGATSATASRGDANLPVTVRHGELLVDVVPSKEPVTVSWK